ncbi:uncharacterized protein N7482_006467 [Penicillium canariense]|uniref:Extracellular protein n=1 Tax=Penicillium canariense TaxID=189055 RepID=A0A9W9HX73_9EURO|nr:uncharacterized protein N7482_006467 [Penicillium canariense]KAJ5159463.1 hypothetical protein N7482_006467 [Penicillium canariense]
MKGIAILGGLLASGASAHMQMMKPYPIRSPLNKDSQGQKDYSYTNPLSTSGSDYPCKGYANDPFESQATYSPGQSYDMELDGSATHGGGSCQLALTYDHGKTFKVIESMLGDCPIAKKYDFTIPSDAPSGEALLAWTWFNKVGNREMYMNCAMVTIGGGSSSAGNKTQSTSKGKVVHGSKLVDKPMAAVGKMLHINHPPMEQADKRDMTDDADDTEMMGQSKTAAFDSLPELFVANAGQAGGCVTIEGEPVDFPKPGDNVVGKIDGNGKGYKCTGSAPFLSSSDSDSSSSSTSKSDSPVTSTTKSDASSTPKSDSKEVKSTSSSKSSSSKLSSSKTSSIKKSSSKKPTSKTSSTTDAGKTTTKQQKETDCPDEKSALSTRSTTTDTPSVSKVASPFGTPTADPRVLSGQASLSGQSTAVASTNNAFSSYVAQWTCTSGEILCSPDGYTWAMCSNSRPIFMGAVAPGMMCRLGEMVAAGWSP